MKNKFMKMMLLTAAATACITGAAHAEGGKIAVIRNMNSSDHTAQFFKGATEEGEALGYTVDTFMSDGDDVKMQDLMNQALNQDYDIWIVSHANEGYQYDILSIGPSDSDALTPYIDKAVDAGIPVLCFDTDAPDSKRIGFVGTDNYEAGRALGEELGKALNGKGTVICETGVVSQAGLILRQQGVQDVLDEKYPDIEIVQTSASGGDTTKGLADIENMITSYDKQWRFNTFNQGIIIIFHFVSENNNPIRCISFERAYPQFKILIPLIKVLDTHLQTQFPTFVFSFVLVRRKKSTMTVYVDCIVKRIDILKDVAVCFFVISNFKSAEPFSFYQRMEGFDAGIGPRIALLGITADHSADANTLQKNSGRRSSIPA